MRTTSIFAKICGGTKANTGGKSYIFVETKNHREFWQVQKRWGVRGDGDQKEKSWFLSKLVKREEGRCRMGPRESDNSVDGSSEAILKRGISKTKRNIPIYTYI